MKKILKSAYQFVPFKREFYSFMKLFWVPGESIYRHLHFKGVFKIWVDSRRSFKMKHYGYQIENEIFWGGLANGFEKESIKLWIKLCEKSNCIIDVGANTGIYSLVAKSVNPASHVYAFEPVKRVFAKLKANAALNNFEIVLLEKAVSSSNGDAVIYDTDSAHTYSVTVNKNLASEGKKTKKVNIETITLDSFVEEFKVLKIDLIKIDVETHEPEVLEGYLRYLPVHKPAILIEILNDEVGQKVNAIVGGMGYLFFNIDEKGSVRKVDKITKSDFYNYLLCDEKTAKELEIM